MSWFGEWFGGGGSGGGSSPAPSAYSAGSVIELARQKHPAFTDRMIPRPVALSHLSDLQDELHQAAQARDAFYVVETATHSLAVFNATVSLPSHAGVSGGRVTFVDPPDGHDEFYVVTRGSRLRGARRWCGILKSETLTLVGDADYWRNVARVDVDYAPVAAVLTSMDDLLVLPASARMVAVAGLALFMGERCAAMGVAVDTRPLARAYADARNTWLDTVAGKGKATPLRVAGIR